ncbi:spr1629 family repressor/antitoxin [Pontibacillus salipaludis]|uniref:Transcriptional regulator n=1 Tax=Pontibacillus salipaludis TaxID=1697394 RepID=A0ABQ1PRN8_9BACI|nr:XRE family transcriptional regulator [Pontibacillus salipaludis]GGD02283.1 transcriptional regulator [Pontibacillus salipaludis]
MFVGQQLVNLRSMNEMSRAELAQKLGITEQAIWQYEKGYTSPKMEIILNLSNIFDVKSKYFYQENNAFNIVNEKHIAYRSIEKNNMQKVNAEKSYLEQIELLLVYIEKTIKHPPNKLLSLRNNSQRIMGEHFNKDNFNKEKIIEELASNARVTLGLNSTYNNNLIFHIEKNGAFVLEKPMDVNTDGYSTWTIHDRPYIVLNSNHKTAVRRNFDLAHELGHLVMHYNEDFQAIDKNSYNKMEKEAHLFAASFLLPKDEFLNDIQFISKVSNPKSYIDLKRKWNVSIAAMGKRVYSLNQMSYQQYRHFNALLRRYGFVKHEPLDNEIDVIKPGKIRSLMTHVLEKKVITPYDLSNKFNLNLSKISSLLDLEPNFFNQYLTPQKEYNFIEIKKV